MSKRRGGMTMLELIIATTLMTTLVVAVGVVVRTGRTAWDAQQGDAERIAAANNAVRHVVRRIRQAQAVAHITAPSETSGTLSLLMPLGEVLVWRHDAASRVVYFGVGSADSVLAEEILNLSFVGYKADAITQTTANREIQSVRCQVRVQLPRETGGDRTVSCWGWLRAW